MRHHRVTCDGKLVTTHDGCIKSSYRCQKCGTEWSKRKRRPAKALEGQCTWHVSVRCDDHPKR